MAGDEYLARLGFDDAGAQEVLDQLITRIAAVGDAYQEFSAGTNKATADLLKYADAAEVASRAATALGDAQAKANSAASSKRNAVPGVAANNTATVTGKATAQDEYSSQQLSEMNAYYAEQEKLTAAQEKARNSTKNLSNELPRLRYALYDVSFATAIVGAGLVAGGAIIESTSIKYQALFANVARTATGLNSIQLDGLKKQLLDITTQIPVTFDEVSQIATLGNQLNVPAADLASFTKTTAEFAATTNVSTDTAATAFGRLGQILHDTNYKGLADDITYLGVKSVATETQIIALAQGIAVTTTAAKFSSGETLALATAMASLGTAPEAARGTVLRVFADITNAVASPGAKLNEFAAISGTTSEKFAQQWKTNASGAFTDFVKGLGATGDVNRNLSALGITATRDQQAIGLLANNTSVLTDAQDNLSKSSNYLDKSFAHISDTTAAKLTVAQNSIKRLFSEIGDSASGPVVTAVDGFNKAIGGLINLLNDPIAAGGIAISVGVTTLIGAMLIGIGILARFTANIAAVRQAQQELGASGGLASGFVKILTGNFNSSTVAVDENTLALRANSAAKEANAGASGIAGAASSAASAEASLGSAASTAEGATSKLTGALGKAGLIGALLALVPVIPAAYGALEEYQLKARGLATDVEALTNKIIGLDQASTKAASAASIGKLLDQGSVKYQANEKIPGLGNTKYLQTENITGAQAYYNQTRTGSNTNGVDVFSGGGAINNAEKLAAQNIQNYDQALSKLAQGGNLKAAKAGIAAFDDAMEKNGLTQRQAESLLTNTNSALGLNADGSEKAASGAKKAGDAAKEAADAFTSYQTSLFSSINANAAVQSDFTSLGNAFFTNGAAAASTGPEIQKAITDIYAATGGGPAAAAQMQALFNALVQGGYASASQLDLLKQTISSLTGGAAVVPDATLSLGNLTSGFNDAANAAAKSADNTAQAAKQIRTLSDYAGDLGGVFTRASEIRFGPAEGVDKVNSDWNSIKDAIVSANKDAQKAIQDSREKIKELNADISSLRADNSINTYFLSIAKEYGDTLRASDLTATIQSNNTKIKQDQTDVLSAQKDASDAVATATDKANKSTKGNTDTAIANRAELTGLIGDYQSYVQSLASSGLNQDQLKAKVAQLKQEFIAQATQLGYTRSDVISAAGSFDDMTTAINRVPRNLTVAVNTKNPGLEAFNEYAAKLSSLNGKNITTNLKQNYDGSGAAAAAAAAAKAARLAVLQAQLTGDQAQYNKAVKAGADNVATRYLKDIQAVSAKINSNGYLGGGYTGDGPYGQEAGVVHTKEFVLNPVGAKLLPRSVLDGMNQGRAPRISPTINVSTSGSQSTGPLELAPYDRQLLMDIRDSIGLTISGNAIQQAANIANTNSNTRRTN